MGKCLFMRKGDTHTAPLTGILAGDLAVGSSCYLMENGVAVEYLIVNQGIPSDSSVYDASCDDTWLLRKDIYEKRVWHSSNVNDYVNSTIHTYLNGDFFNRFGNIEQAVIKQVKIPCLSDGSTSATVSNLTTKVFLLSATEVWIKTTAKYGGCLSYFDGCSTSANTAEPKRVATLDGTASLWWTRHPASSGTTTSVFYILSNGAYNWNSATNTNIGIRPALVIPKKAVFDETTLILKGVK